MIRLGVFNQRPNKFSIIRGGSIGYRFFASSPSIWNSQGNNTSCGKTNLSRNSGNDPISCGSGRKNTTSSISGSMLGLAFWSCRSTWKRAGINTFRCLIGCTTGDFSALWMLQSYYPEMAVNTSMLISSKFVKF